MIHDLFSKRQRRQRGEMPDVLQCDTLPIDLKKQVGMLIEEALGHSETPNNHLAVHVYAQIIQALAEEWARPDLLPLRFERYFEKPLVDIFVDEPDVERSLDVIELVFRSANRQAENAEYYPGFDGRGHVDDCIEELNTRFREHGVGYAYVNDEIIRVDSEMMHTEVVKPVVHFLNVPGFEGAQEEFFTAYSHYRQGLYKEAITAANKAFESTMKVICEQKGWEYKKRDTASKLIMICIEKGLFPGYYQSHLSSLFNLLEGGVPAIRNNEGGHGQGVEVKTVEPHIVSYTLHMAASAILLLVNSATSMDSR
ncbi:STM4504/CBY_0614 family protein [Pseudomonas aeruginosa]